jgi:hypothetical protein
MTAADEWLRRNFPWVPFERYADDVVIHCVSQQQAGVRVGSGTLQVEGLQVGVTSGEDPDRLLQGRPAPGWLKRA